MFLSAITRPVELKTLSTVALNKIKEINSDWVVCGLVDGEGLNSLEKPTTEKEILVSTES